MWFEAISGLRINLNKSEIYPMGNVDNVDNVEDLDFELGCKVRSLLSFFLGLPLGARHNSMIVWDGIEERFCKRLTLLKRQHIYKGGEGHHYSKHSL